MRYRVKLRRVVTMTLDVTVEVDAPDADAAEEAAYPLADGAFDKAEDAGEGDTDSRIDVKAVEPL